MAISKPKRLKKQSKNNHKLRMLLSIKTKEFRPQLLNRKLKKENAKNPRKTSQ